MLPLLHTVLVAASTASALTSNLPRDTGRYTFAAPYDQSFQDGYSILKHIGSLGPYANRVSYGVGRDPPASCAVDQVIMIRRHGERYPQPGDRKGLEGAVQRLYQSGITEWKGDLSFLNTWKWFVEYDGLYGLETNSGPYSGLLTSYKHGAEYRVRYGHLWNQKAGSVTPMWTSDYERVIQTARKFGEGFFGWNYTNSIALNIIPETDNVGANSLTPTCPNENNTICNSFQIQRPQFSVAAARFNEQNPGLNVTMNQVYALMYLTAFELNVRGYSDWVNAFTLDEWLAFGYTQNLIFYYCAGPGDSSSSAIGSLYLNASLALLNEGPKKSHPIVFNFAHDTNITPILAALGIGNPVEDLPLDRIPFPNAYDVGDLMPMGGHLTIERLSCNATIVSPEGIYVRMILNEAVVPFNSCQDGPGFTCSLTNYTEIVKKLPDFASSCNLNSTVPQHLSFWWDYNTTTESTMQTAPYIPFQGAESV